MGWSAVVEPYLYTLGALCIDRTKLIALDAAKQAAAQPEGAKDPQTKNMIRAIEDTMKDREEKKAKL